MLQGNDSDANISRGLWHQNNTQRAWSNLHNNVVCSKILMWKLKTLLKNVLHIKRWENLCTAWTSKVSPISHRPWETLSTNFCGPLPSEDYLFVVTDGYSSSRNRQKCLGKHNLHTYLSLCPVLNRQKHWPNVWNLKIRENR